MVGNVRAKGRCPKCGGKWSDTGRDIECPQGHRPASYYAYWYHEGDHRVYGFRSYKDAVDYLIDVDRAIKKGRFDPRHHQAKTLRAFRMSVLIGKWIKDRQADVDTGQLAPSYMRKLKQYAPLFVDFFGADDIRTVNKGKLRDFLRHLQEPGTRKPKTCKNIMDVLRKAMTDACHEYDLIDSVPKFPKITYELPEV